MKEEEKVRQGLEVDKRTAVRKKRFPEVGI